MASEITETYIQLFALKLNYHSGLYFMNRVLVNSFLGCQLSVSTNNSVLVSPRTHWQINTHAHTRTQHMHTHWHTDTLTDTDWHTQTHTVTHRSTHRHTHGHIDPETHTDTKNTDLDTRTLTNRRALMHTDTRASTRACGTHRWHRRPTAAEAPPCAFLSRLWLEFITLGKLQAWEDF